MKKAAHLRVGYLTAANKLEDITFRSNNPLETVKVAPVTRSALRRACSAAFHANVSRLKYHIRDYMDGVYR